MRIGNLRKGISNIGRRSGEFFQRHPLLYSSLPLIARGAAIGAGLVLGVSHLNGAEASSYSYHISGHIQNMFGVYYNGHGDMTYLIGTGHQSAGEGALNSCFAVHVGPDVSDSSLRNLEIGDHIDVDATPILDSENPFKDSNTGNCDILAEGKYEAIGTHKYPSGDGVNYAGIALVGGIVSAAILTLSRGKKRNPEDSRKEVAEVPKEK